MNQTISYLAWMADAFHRIDFEEVARSACAEREADQRSMFARLFDLERDGIMRALMQTDGPLYLRVPDVLAPHSTTGFWVYHLNESAATTLRQIMCDLSPKYRKIREKAGKGQP